MNVHAIRRALEQLDTEHNGGRGPYATDVWCRWADAIQTVGLRACDEWENVADGCSRSGERFRLAVIADILREAGVEVER